MLTLQVSTAYIQTDITRKYCVFIVVGDLAIKTSKHKTPHYNAYKLPGVFLVYRQNPPGIVKFLELAVALLQPLYKTPYLWPVGICLLRTFIK